ncbi:hypothetical protein PLICRDRAFT_693926 [Plicaturopsis crispa FD-325 SS-3]|nr:hypothetical protein PLICRDRAFT_693926 [Plicaturopsis crispa FD-325 SS-3]
MSTTKPHFVTLGMFIIDEFTFSDEDGKPTGQTLPPQIGGGGTYANVGARIWLPAEKLGMIVDRGHDFPEHIQNALQIYGSDMWMFRDNMDRGTTRALNAYRGDHRSFEYLTPRVRITPRDLVGTRLEQPETLHFICSPSRAGDIMAEVHDLRWSPTTIYEPIPDRCIPEELPALVKVLPFITVLSPNAEEALSLLSIPLPPTKPKIDEAAARFLELGIGETGGGSVILRSGGLGAYVATRKLGGRWVDAFWTAANGGTDKIVDVTGAGNSFLGGLSAGLLLAGGDIYEATFYATVSASFIIEQEGLPKLTKFGDAPATEEWNGDSARRRLEELQTRYVSES